jgi:aldehyde:ferredoxin oxidoreductase
MECGERGLIEGGPRFDQPGALLGWLDDIALRRGLGDELAEGSLRLAKSIGHDSIDFAPQVKGLEMPGYEPRSLQTLALGFAVGARGADHNRSGAYEADFSEDVDRLCGGQDSGKRAVETEDRAALLDSLILCKFVRGALHDFYAECGELLSAVTGHHFGEADLRSVSRRVVGLRKAFNIREGWVPADDTLPERFLSEPLSSGPARGARLPRTRLAEMVRSYNLARGWNEDGMLPTSQAEEICAELELSAEGILTDRAGGDTGLGVGVEVRGRGVDG